MKKEIQSPDSKLTKGTRRSWLITAFTPFDNRAENNSQAVQEEIRLVSTERAKSVNWNFDFYYVILPTEYDRCYVVLMDEVKRLKNEGIHLEGVLSLGEGAEDFKIETQANNLDDVEQIPDNKGVIRIQQKIFKDLKADFIKLRFPVAAFTKIRTSINPGFFVCNHLCARMGVEFADSSHPYFGFIHVPLTGMGGAFTPNICAEIILTGLNRIELAISL